MLCLTLALPGAASAGLTVGVNDNGYSFFSDPLFTKLHVRVARMGVPWDVAIKQDKRQLNYDRAWLTWAKMDHVTPLISFGLDGGSTYIPSTAKYRAAVQKFLRTFPSVRNYTAWNEPDWIYRTLSRNPAQAAAYFNTLTVLCRSCTIAAGDLYLPVPHLGPWLQKYARALHYRPKAWALHPYDDVRGHKTAQIQTFMKYTRGPVWLDEISGVESRGHWHFPDRQSVAAAGRDERFLFALPKRFHRITAIYHYQWRAVPHVGWDSGLLGTDGKPRPAYSTFAAAVKGHLP
jgi:hypothetical protein